MPYSFHDHEPPEPSGRLLSEEPISVRRDVPGPDLSQECRWVVVKRVAVDESHDGEVDYEEEGVSIV